MSFSSVTFALRISLLPAPLLSTFYRDLAHSRSAPPPPPLPPRSAMSTPSGHLDERQLPVSASQLSDEARFWRRFRAPQLVALPQPPTSIHFATLAPHAYVVTSGMHVDV